MANSRAHGDGERVGGRASGLLGVAGPCSLFAVIAAGFAMHCTAADTQQTFDTAGTAYVLSQNGSGPGPALMNIGGSNGNILRLASANVGAANSIAFNLSAPGAFAQIVAEFDFRMSPGPGGGADGLGFALLNTANFATMGEVTTFGYEEPSFLGSFGVGFDINQGAGELNGNHVSIHFNGSKIAEFNAAAVNLSSGNFIHAQITMRPGSGFSDVSIVLTPAGGAPVTVVNNYIVQGFTPFEGRVMFGARSGGQTADHDLDNINVQFQNPQLGAFNFAFPSFTTVEASAALIAVHRTLGSNGTATVQYSTANGTAVAGVDYAASSATLTFTNGETTKMFAIAILNNAATNANKTFAISLSNPTGGTTLGATNAVTVTIWDDDNPALAGQWDPQVVGFPALPFPLVSININLLPDGRLFIFDRHGTNFGGTDGDPFLWDRSGGSNVFTRVPLVFTNAGATNYDLFCAGATLLGDGRLLLAGGHITDGDGENKLTLFDPLRTNYLKLPDMNLGRWYPTTTMLPNGDVLIEAGTYGNLGEFVNKVPQVFDVAGGTLRSLTNAAAQHLDFPVAANYYPFNFVAPNGKVFIAGPQALARYLDPAGTGAFTNVATSSISYRDYGTAVMYDDAKVFMTGGNPHEPVFAGPWVYFPSRVTEVIDLSAATPAWRVTNPLNAGRRFSTATLLPDGKVLMTGGTAHPGFQVAAGSVYWAEVWDPQTETFTPLAAQSRYRTYHANAILMPDGRVISTGGGHPGPIDGDAQPNAEVFSPPYLFKGARPVITRAPDAVTYAAAFTVETPDAAGISNVNWIRLGAVTHNFDQSQRMNRLTFAAAAGALTVNTPATPVLCPPGHYMLFILNSNGVPSVAKTVQVGMGIASIARAGADNFVTAATVAGTKYQLESNDALSSTNNVWTPLGTAFNATGLSTTFTNAGGALVPNRFYRIRQVP